MLTKELNSSREKIDKDIFVNGNGTYFEWNSNNPKLQHLRSLYEGSKTDRSTRVKAETSENPFDVCLTARDETEQLIDQKPKMIKISQGKNILQPAFMETTGTMCITELWASKEITRAKIRSKYKVNTNQRVTDIESEPLFKPGKWKNEESLKKKMRRQAEQKTVVPIPAMMNDKIGLRVYKTPVREHADVSPLSRNFLLNPFQVEPHFLMMKINEAGKVKEESNKRLISFRRSNTESPTLSSRIGTRRSHLRL